MTDFFSAAANLKSAKVVTSDNEFKHYLKSLYSRLTPTQVSADTWHGYWCPVIDPEHSTSNIIEFRHVLVHVRAKCFVLLFVFVFETDTCTWNSLSPWVPA